jgi:hypothetical protein
VSSCPGVISVLGFTYLFLLFIHVTNLEPDVLFGQRTRRVGYNVFEALQPVSLNHRCLRVDTYVQTLIKLLLLLVDYAETEVYLIGLLEVWLHAHNLRKGLLGMLERAIAVVQDADAVPELGFL